MESLALIGAVSNAAQFYEFALQFLSQLKEVYGSPNTAQEDIIDLSSVTTDLARFLDKLSAIDLNEAESRPTNEGKVLARCVQESIEVAEELHSTLQVSQVQKRGLKEEEIVALTANLEKLENLRNKVQEAIRTRSQEQLTEGIDPKVRYVRKRLLGCGGQAVVDEVRDTVDNKVYALKTYTFRYGELEYQAKAATFLREVKIMGDLSRVATPSTPFIVRLVRWHQDNATHQYHLVMDPVATGGCLEALLQRQFATDAEIISQKFLRTAFTNLTEGLDFIHRHSVRHKDIKPANILIHDGRLLYADFGVSLEFDPLLSDSGTTESTRPQYTYGYAAPELIMRQPRNKKADIFSLGCVLFEVLAARGRFLSPQLESDRETIFGEKFVGYGFEAMTGRLKGELDRFANDAHLSSISRYIPLIRGPLDAEAERRPDAEELRHDAWEVSSPDVEGKLPAIRRRRTHVVMVNISWMDAVKGLFFGPKGLKQRLADTIKVVDLGDDGGIMYDHKESPFLLTVSVFPCPGSGIEQRQQAMCVFDTGCLQGNIISAEFARRLGFAEFQPLKPKEKTGDIHDILGAVHVSWFHSGGTTVFRDMRFLVSESAQVDLVIGTHTLIRHNLLSPPSVQTA